MFNRLRSLRQGSQWLRVQTAIWHKEPHPRQMQETSASRRKERTTNLTFCSNGVTKHPMPMRSLCCFCVALSLAYAQSQALTIGQPIERTISGSEKHLYTLTLEAGQFLHAVVDQHGIDVVVRVLAPDGLQLMEVDSPNGTEGPEEVQFQAETSGQYRLEVRSLDVAASPGRYVASVREILSPTQYAARLKEVARREAATSAWISANAVRLQTTEAGHGFADMQPLKAIVGKARVVALGEATHGTHEFFQLKHRMLEFLVNEMNFNIFAIEANMPEGFDLNEYVLNGKGDPEKLLSGLYFWTWDTEEVLQMIRWMRQYNADERHQRKVKFYGFDMQFPSRAVKVALAYLRRVDEPESRRLGAVLAVAANPLTAQTYDTLPGGRRAEIAAAAHALVARLDEHPGGLDWRIARQHARIAEQALASPGRNNLIGALNARDRAMAENIRWLIDQEGKDAKVVLWAHNGHVARKVESGVEWMGSYLGKSLGADMVVFGFAFNRGSFQAVEIGRGLRQFNVPPAPKGSLDAILAASGIGIGAVDLRKLPAGSVREWFQEPRLTRSIGAVFADSQALQLQPEEVLDDYDGILFVENTTAARPNPGGAHPATVIEKTPRNLDFEDLELDGWRSPVARNSGFRIGITHENAASGTQAAFIERDPGAWPGEFAGQLEQQVDASPFRGKRVRFSASVRTDLQSGDGAAYLWLQVAQNSLFALQSCSENMADRPIRTEGWRRFAIECRVPKQADRVSFGLAMTGIGRVLVDKVAIETLPQ